MLTSVPRRTLRHGLRCRIRPEPSRVEADTSAAGDVNSQEAYRQTGGGE